MANTWRGIFPHRAQEDGLPLTTRVASFPPNGYGLYDMIGNVWEWTADWYAPRHHIEGPAGCCLVENPQGAEAEGSHDPCQPQLRIPRKVLKGGSHLCAPNYCRRYRPAARHPQAVDSSATHIGFRCVLRSNAGPCG